HLPHFFFQAEDGIRDFHVTGVQTCALPISLGWRPWPSPETTNAPAQGGAGREKRTRSVASLVLLRGPPAAAGPSIHRGVDDQRSSVEPCREYVTGFGSPAAGRDNVGSLGLTSPDLCSIGIDRLPTRGKSAGPPKRGCGRQASWTPWRISDTRTCTRTTRASRNADMPRQRARRRLSSHRAPTRPAPRLLRTPRHLAPKPG